MKALVAYASRCGSTKGIADFVGEKLRRKGVQADVREAGSVRDAELYDAFVVGSAVYMFHWLKDAKQFVSKNSVLLVSRPVWLFSSGPVGSQTVDSQGRGLLEVSGPKELDELRALSGARDHRVFFGALDGSRLTGTMGFAYRMARRSKSARDSMPEGDFRDWRSIEAWADEIAAVLMPADRVV